MDTPVLANQQTYSARTLNTAYKTYQGMNGEKDSRESMLSGLLHDDDEYKQSIYSNLINKNQTNTPFMMKTFFSF